jgi:hypothetical protein
VVTIYDARRTIARDVEALLRETYGGQMLTSVIHKNVRLDEAASDRSSIFSSTPAHVVLRIIVSCSRRFSAVSQRKRGLQPTAKIEGVRVTNTPLAT